MKYIWLLLIFASGCSLSTQKVARFSPTNQDMPLDYGPPSHSQWPELFYETPDYPKMFSQKVQNQIFSWAFGPTFFRGRLNPNEVQILLIGQDNSWEMAAARRIFVDFPGRRLQHFLSYIGIERSYLFLNVSPYAIVSKNLGQQERDLFFGQNAISQHRNKIFTYAAKSNADSLALILALGKLGKEAVSHWARDLGMKCQEGRDFRCVGAKEKLGVKKRVVVIGIPDLNTAPNEETDFTLNLRFAAKEIRTNAPIEWERALPEQEFQLGTRAVPHQDLLLPTLAKLRGPEATLEARNRETAQFDPHNPIPETKQQEAFYHISNQPFDTGPCNAQESCPLSNLLKGTSRESPLFPIPQKLTSSPSYRGRLGGVDVLVLSDLDSLDDLMTGRYLTGNAGQKLQSFLRAAGLSRSYLILKMAPFFTNELTKRERRKLLFDRKIQKWRRNLVDKIFSSTQPQLVICLGPFACEASRQMLPKAKTLELWSLETPGYMEQWNKALKQMSEWQYQKDHDPIFQFRGLNATIPRLDLPFGLPWWFGTTGDHAILLKERGPDANEQLFFATPSWLLQKYRSIATP